MIPFVATTLALGTLLGVWLSAAAALSGKLALGLSTLPYAGFGLGVAFC